MEYDIFREELAIKYPAYGHALWVPSPRGRYTAVEIGDVGFIREGYFHRLFNVLLPEDHDSHRGGVPQYHEPLVIRMSEPTNTDTLLPNNFRSIGVSDMSDVHRRAASGPDEALQFAFSCSSRRRGAILSLPVPATRKDTAVRDIFAKCIIKHIDSWFAFARDCGFGISREDIILVTGCDIARSWANIAFQEMQEQVSFGVQVTGNFDVNWTFTPEGAAGVPFKLGPSGQNLLEDQCIFVRGFRVKRFPSKIFSRLRAAAGPARIPGEDDPPDPDAGLVSIPANTQYQDPIITLLEYIATRASGCDMALVHDDDLLCIDSTSLESLRPDIVMSRLRESAPKIWQHRCDCSPIIHSDRSASKAKAAVKVAALSNFSVAVTSEPVNHDITQTVFPFHHPTTRHVEQDPSSNSIRVVTFRLLNTIIKIFPPQHERRGDRMLESARKITDEFESVISLRERQIIEERITFAEDVKLGLDSKRGISKFRHAREFCRAARDACQFAKTASTRALDPTNTALFDRVMSVAQRLYRCYVACQDAFPPPDTADWVDYVWFKACGMTGVDPRSLALPHIEEFVGGYSTLLLGMKTKIMHLVESLYGFDTSRAQDSISSNAKLARALLTNVAFICREPNIGGTPQHPYRHPIIQEAINMMWFQSKDGDGVVFHEHFTPIPIQTISLVLTVVECCIYEWTDGTRNVSDWNENRYRSAYNSHISLLSDFRDHHNPQEEDLLQIQTDILRNARINAGVPHEPVTESESERLDPDAVIDENLLTYDVRGKSVPTTTVSPY